MPSVTFQYSVTWDKHKGCYQYILYGRSFTAVELKKAVISACKGYLNDFYINCWSLPLWEIIEAIELVAESQEEAEAANATDIDVFDKLGL